MKTPSGLDANLPVFDLLKEAIQLLWHKRRQVIKLFLPIIAVLALCDFVVSLAPQEKQHSLSLGLLSLTVLLSVMMATGCHKFTLAPAENQVNPLRNFTRSEGHYFLRVIQIILLVSVVFFCIFLGLMLLFQVDQKWVPLLMLVTLLPCVYLWARLSITLPEVALGVFSPLKRAWCMSHGNGMRLVLVVIIIPLLFMLPVLLLKQFDNAVVLYLVAALSYAMSLVSLVLLSLSYRFLSEFYDAVHPEENAPAENLNKPDDSASFDA